MLTFCISADKKSRELRLSKKRAAPGKIIGGQFMPIFDNYESQFMLRAPGADMGLKKITIKDGASLLKFNARVRPDQNTGTLIVGIGGSGFKLLNVLKKKYSNTLTDAENLVMEDRHVRFLAIDSDTGVGTGLNGGNGTLKESELCGLWHTPAFSRYIGMLLSDVNQDPQKEWFDTRFAATEELNDGGCGGKRQKGRLMLSLKDNYDYIYNKLAAIFSDFARNAFSQVNVIIVAGISGGTGSGCIVDISYMLRKAALAAGCPTTFEAFIFTPNFHRQEIRNGQIANPDLLYRNFVACLKEIDTLMTATETGFIYRFPSQKYPDGNVPGISDAPTDIFDSCTIVDSVSDTGAELPAAEVVNILSDYIIDMVSDISLEDPATHMPVQLLNSILNNEANTAAAISDLIFQQRMPNNVDYRYRSIGYKTAEFPVDEITNYMSARILQNIRKTMFSDSIIPHCETAARTFLVNQRLYPQNQIDKTVVDIYYEKSADAYSSLMGYYQRMKMPADKNAAKVSGSIEPFQQYNKVKQFYDQMENDPGTANVLAFRTDWINALKNDITNNMNEIMRSGNLVGKAVTGDDLTNENMADIGLAGPYAASVFGKKMIEMLEAVKKNIKDGANNFASEHINQTMIQNQKKNYDSGVNKMQKPRTFHAADDFKAGKETVERAVKASAVAALKLIHVDPILKAIDSVIDFIKEKCENEYDIYCAAFARITSVMTQDADSIVADAVDNPAAIVDIQLMGAPNTTGKELKLNELIDFYTDPEKIKAELTSSIYSSMLEEPYSDQWLKRLGHSFLVPDNIRNKLSIYLRDLKADSDINSKDILERLLFILYSPQTLTIKQSIELFKKHFDPNITAPANTKWNNLENELQALYPQLTPKQMPLEMAATEIVNIITTLGFCSNLSPQMNHRGVTIDSFPTYDMLILTDRSKYLSEKISSRFDLNLVVPARSEEVSGYSMVKVRFGLPLFAYANMAEWQKVYVDHVDNNNFIEAGVHQSVKGWRQFQPLVNLDSFRFMYEGDNNFTNLFQSSSIYDEEVAIMDEITDKTDKGIKTYGYITEQLTQTVPPETEYYILNTVSDYSDRAKNAVTENVMNTLADDVSAVTSALAAFDADPNTDNDALIELYNKAFEDKWNEQITTTLFDRLKTVNAPLKRSNLKYGRIFFTNNNASTDNYLDSVEQGGVYKVIRFSPYFRNELDKMDKFCGELTEKINVKKEELRTAAREKWVKEQIAKRDIILKAHQLEMIELFAKCYAVGHINYRYDANIGTLQMTLKVGTREVLLLNTNISTGRNYEKEFRSYYLFLRFMQYLDDPANAVYLKAFDNATTGINAEIINAITEANGKAPVAAKMKELVDTEFPTSILDLIPAVSEYLKYYNNTPPVVFGSLPVADTKFDAADFNDNFTDDNFPDTPNAGRTFYGQVYAFYAKLNSYIEDFAR